MKTGYKAAGSPKIKPSTVKGYLSDAIPEMKPMFSLTEKELPALKDWKVGQTYQIVITAKEVSLSQDSRDNYHEKRATFEIQKAEVEEKDS